MTEERKPASPEPPRRGRPPGSGDGRTARVFWRTTPERKDRAQALAGKRRQSVAALLDDLVDQAAK